MNVCPAWLTHGMTTTKTKAVKAPGDALIGAGTVLAILALILALATGGGVAFVHLLVVSGLFLVVIGYLKRISAALTARQ